MKEQSTIIRILIYKGESSWVESTFAASYLKPGIRRFGDECSIEVFEREEADVPNLRAMMLQAELKVEPSTNNSAERARRGQ